MPRTTQPVNTATRKPPGVFVIGLILASAVFVAVPFQGNAGPQQEPPPNLSRLVAQRETATQKERNEYTYRQVLTIEELDKGGAVKGRFKETRDIVFSPKHERTEEVIGKAESTLASLTLTPEDFRDIREIQPLVLTEELLWNYDTRFRGEEFMDDVDCWVLAVKPRQILDGQRFFDGMMWVDKKEYNIVRMEGQAVPQIRTTKSENLFPKFTTVRKPVDGNHWFPTYTYADDVLYFKNGAIRERLRIAYSNYRRFGVESTFTVK